MKEREIYKQELDKLMELFKTNPHPQQVEIVKKYNLGTPTNLSHYLRGRRPLNLKIALIMAKELGIKISDFSPRLQKEYEILKEAMNITPIEINQKKIPLISWVQAGGLTDITNPANPNAIIESGKYIYVDNELNDRCFALKVNDSSMNPQFFEDDIIVIDPMLKPLPGDYVVAQRQSVLTEGIEGTFKKYKPLGLNDFGQEVFELVPLNQDYPVIRSDREICQIVGTLVEHRRLYRRKSWE